jgi:hypothetical protein
MNQRTYSINKSGNKILLSFSNKPDENDLESIWREIDTYTSSIYNKSNSDYNHPRRYDVAKMFFIDGKTLNQIAKLYNLTSGRIGQILRDWCKGYNKKLYTELSRTHEYNNLLHTRPPLLKDLLKHANEFIKPNFVLYT